MRVCYFWPAPLITQPQFPGIVLYICKESWLVKCYETRVVDEKQHYREGIHEPLGTTAHCHASKGTSVQPASDAENAINAMNCGSCLALKLDQAQAHTIQVAGVILVSTCPDENTGKSYRRFLIHQYSCLPSSFGLERVAESSETGRLSAYSACSQFGTFSVPRSNFPAAQSHWSIKRPFIKRPIPCAHTLASASGTRAAVWLLTLKRFTFDTASRVSRQNC